MKSRNFYWLSTRDGDHSTGAGRRKIPTGEYDISTWTPTKTFADYTALNNLPRVDLDVTAQHTKKQGHEGSTTVTVHNPTSTLALAVHLEVKKSLERHASAAKARRQ